MSDESSPSPEAPETPEAPRRRTRRRTPRETEPAEPAPAPIPDDAPAPRRRTPRASPKTAHAEPPPEPASSEIRTESAPPPAAPPREERRSEETSDDSGSGEGRDPRETREPREYRDPREARFPRTERGDRDDSALGRRRRRRGRAPVAVNGRPDREFARPLHRPLVSPDDVQPDGFPKDGPVLKLHELQSLPLAQVLAKAGEMQIPDAASLRRSDLIREIVFSNSRRNGPVLVRGVLEVMPDGFGFLRSPANRLLASPEDVMIPPPVLRRHGLRAGDVMEGELRSPKPKDRYFGLCRIESINGESPASPRKGQDDLENMVAVFPHQRLILERLENPSLPMRVIDLVAPLGKGQRGLIVAPPRTGATLLLQDMARSLRANNPETELFVLLIGDRPEEVTQMRRTTQAQVVAATFDEPPERQVQVAESVLEMARRKVELGKDVVILLDSLTRLARACHALKSQGVRSAGGDPDGNTLQGAKRFFGSARKVENGGSLTILATARVDTGCRMEGLLYEEFKSMANLEIFLDPSLVKNNVYPAVHISRSGARNEELLMHPEELERVRSLRSLLEDHDPVEAMELLVGRLKKTKTNPEFLLTLQLS